MQLRIIRYMLQNQHIGERHQCALKEKSEAGQHENRPEAIGKSQSHIARQCDQRTGNDHPMNGIVPVGQPQEQRVAKHPRHQRHGKHHGNFSRTQPARGEPERKKRHKDTNIKINRPAQKGELKRRRKGAESEFGHNPCHKDIMLKWLC